MEKEINEINYDQEIENVKRAIAVAESYDLPAEQLYDKLHQLEDAIKDSATPPAKEAKDDAPFCRMLLLIEVDKDNKQDALDCINYLSNRGYNIHHFTEI